MALITHQTIAPSRKVALQPCHTMPIEPFGSRSQCQHAHMVTRRPLRRDRNCVQHICRAVGTELPLASLDRFEWDEMRLPDLTGLSAVYRQKALVSHWP